MFKRLGLKRRASSGRASALRRGLGRAPRVEPLEGRALMTLNFGSVGTLGAPTITPSRTAIDGAGNTYVMGTYQGQVVFDPGTNAVVKDSGFTPNMFVAKYGPSNNLLWADSFDDDESTFTGGGGDANLLTDIAIDSAGNAYVVGQFSSHPVTFGSGVGAPQLSPDGNDAFLVKLDSAGKVAPGMARSFGAGNDDRALSVAIDPAGTSVYVGGAYQGTVNFNPGGAGGEINSGSSAITDGFVLKVTNNLGFVWVSDDAFNTGGDLGVAADGLNSVFAVGNNAFGSTITKFSAVTGQVVMSQTITPSSLNFATRVVSDNLGNAYVSGTFVGTGVNFNPASTTTTVLDSTGGADAYLVKYDNNLGLTWARRFGSANNDVPAALAIDAAKNLYLGGFFSGPASFGQTGPGSPVLRTANDAVSQADGFVIRVDSSGNYLDGQNIGGTGDDVVTGLAVNPAGTVGVTGTYSVPASFGTTPLGSPGSSNIFFGRLNTAAVVTPPGTGTTPPGTGTTPPGTGTTPPPVTVVYPSVAGVLATKTKKKGITSFNVSFGTDLTGAINASAISVDVLGKNKKKGYVQPLKVAGVTYDPASHTMTVRLAKPRKGAMQLTVGAGAVVSTTGGPLLSSYQQVFKG